MKIGIIVYSNTGNTYSVAEKLKEKLGSNATIERIELVEGQDIRNKNPKLKQIPDLTKYNFIVFGSPVHAFNLSLLMKSYLNQIDTLKDKQVLCFVTEAFAYPCLGGNKAISEMTRICKEKGAEIIETGVINWGSKKRDEMINKTIDKFNESIK